MSDERPENAEINWTTMPPVTVERIVVWDSATGDVKWDTGNDPKDDHDP